MLRRCLSAMRVLLESFVPEMPRQLLSIFLLASLLAYPLAFLVPLDTFATVPRWCRRFVHRVFSASKTQQFLFLAQQDIIARFKPVFRSFVQQASIALRSPACPQVAPMAHTVTYLDCLKPNHALQAVIAREAATIQWLYHAQLDTFAQVQV